MTIEEQVQAEAKGMIEIHRAEIAMNTVALTFGQLSSSWYEYEMARASKQCAIVTINKIISLRVPPMEHYEQIKQAIINYK